jgi:hypothetical protein
MRRWTGQRPFYWRSGNRSEAANPTAEPSRLKNGVCADFNPANPGQVRRTRRKEDFAGIGQVMLLILHGA